MKSNIHSFFFLLFIFVFQLNTIAQSPDSRICNCSPGGGIAADFMLGTKAAFGSTNVSLTRRGEIRPQHLQSVKFTIPVLDAKAGCRATYSIIVYDNAGTKVHEASGRNNIINYLFPDCTKTYEVTLTASVNSTAGSDGNCTRNISFTVKPQCNTVVCDCFNSKKGTTATSGDLNISGTFKCIPPAPTKRVYLFKFDIINKTDCILVVESLTVLGTTQAVPAHSILAKGNKKAVSVGFTTPLTTAAPTGSKVAVKVAYSLNGKKCSITMDMPYEACSP